MKIGFCTLLCMYVLTVFGQDSMKGSALQEIFKWEKIYKRKKGAERIFFLEKYIDVRTGNRVGLSTCMDKESCLLMYLDLNAENVPLLKEFIDIPNYLFTDTLVMNLLMYQNYCLVAKRIGDRIFETIPTKDGGYKHIVLVMRAADKEKALYVDMEEKEGQTVIRTADFLTNEHETIPWDETKYIYYEANELLLNPTVVGKKSFSVGDRTCIAGYVFHPANHIEIAPPTKDTTGVVYYRFYMNGYEKINASGKAILKRNLPAAITPYVFDDSAQYYPYFILEFANAADSVLEYVAVKTRGGGFKSLSTIEFLDFVLPGLPRRNGHEIIEYKKKKTLFVEFKPDADPYWNYHTERMYDDYLTVYLYDAKLKYQKKIRNVLMRFTHADGTKAEFLHDLNDPKYKQIYNRAYFRIHKYGLGPALFIQ